MNLSAPCRFLWTAGRRRPGRCLGLLALLAALGLAGYYGGRHAWAWYHYRAGERALAGRQFAPARAHLEACLRVWPDSAQAHLLAARAARRAGDLAAAKEHLDDGERLLSPEAEPPPHEVEWRERFTLERALLLAQTGQLPSVEKYLRARLQQGDPETDQILDALTWQLMMSHRLGEARSFLNRWLEGDPTNCEALVRRGWVAERVFEPSQALDDYRQALALEPDRDPVRLRIAEILVQLTRAKDALPYLEELLQRQAGDPEVRFTLARCYHLLNRIEEARATLDALLAEHPRHARALGEQGKIALEAGRPEEAERLLRQALRYDPHDQDINYGLYQCLQALGKREEARALFAKLQRIKADQQQMGKLMAQVMRTPTDADTRYRIGMVFLENGFEGDGLRWLLTVLEYDPRHRPAHLALADYFGRKEQPERAARHRRIAEELAPAPGTVDEKKAVP